MVIMLIYYNILMLKVETHTIHISYSVEVGKLCNLGVDTELYMAEICIFFSFLIFLSIIIILYYII